MGRRRRSDFDWVLAIVQLAAVLVGFSFIYPPLRQTLVQLGVLAGSIAVLGLLLFVGVRVFDSRSRRGSADDTFYRAQDLDTLPTYPPENSGQLATHPSGSPKAAGLPFLIERLRTIDWFQFEKVVAAAYRKLGYRVTRRGGANPDGGIDLILEKNGEQTAVQCKHWKIRDVGVRAVREFLGALTDAGLKKGVVVTLCGYTGDAKQLAEKHGIEILNETALVSLLESIDAAHDPEMLAILNDKTKYCAKCDGIMVLRTAWNGLNPGSQFWGCTNYPRC